MKAVMAITGLILIGFLLMHMYGNLKVFLGAEAFDHYAHWLKEEMMYPLLPKGWFIWIFRFVLLAALILHMYSAIKLWKRSKIAAGPAYEKTKRLAQTYSARTMRYGGIILFLFIIFHLLQFTVKAVTPGFNPATDGPYKMVVLSFQQWWMVLIYAICMVAVCMHVRHGFWSAFTTLGANTSAKARQVLNVLAYVVAIALFVGFMIMPISVLFGLVGLGS